MKLKCAQLFRDLQNSICSALEKADGSAAFSKDLWTRQDISGDSGGGGDTRVLRKGNVFEQAGVNFSEVSGTLPEEMSLKLIGKNTQSEFYATGVSLVIHPFSPMIPTTHANFRYLEVENQAWFGGGMDLTPYYLFPEDAKHFHLVLKKKCDQHDETYYPKFKEWCDEYFYLPHRKETRGVGGIFYDYLGKELQTDSPEWDKLFSFVSDIGSSFVEAYLPIVERCRALTFSDREKDFQIYRRGRYVEFNLIYDRGTLFGLKTGGRTESILMSLPPLVRWEYNYSVVPDSKEAELMEVLKNPKNWI